MNNIVGKVYRHVKTGHHYKVTAVGRSVERPDRKVIVYSQLFESTLVIEGKHMPSSMNIPYDPLAGPGVPLPVGSVWVRDEESFFGTDNGKPRFEHVVSNDEPELHDN